jgi:hypothetical protein
LAVKVADVQSHAAVVTPSVVDRHAGDHPAFFEFSAAPIHVQMVVPVVIRDVQVGASVPVDVGQDHAQSLAVRQSGSLGNVDELFPVELEERIRQRSEPLWRTDVAPSRIARARANRIVRHGPVEIPANVQIHPAIARQVAPRGTGTPAIVGQT